MNVINSSKFIVERRVSFSLWLTIIDCCSAGTVVLGNSVQKYGAKQMACDVSENQIWSIRKSSHDHPPLFFIWWLWWWWFGVDVVCFLQCRLICTQSQLSPFFYQGNWLLPSNKLASAIIWSVDTTFYFFFSSSRTGALKEKKQFHDVQGFTVYVSVCFLLIRKLNKTWKFEPRPTWNRTKNL